jgi:hypothetical protein
MEMRGQQHSTAQLLYPQEIILVSMDRRMSMPQDQSGLFEDRKISCPYWD